MPDILSRLCAGESVKVRTERPCGLPAVTLVPQMAAGIPGALWRIGRQPEGRRKPVLWFAVEDLPGRLTGMKLVKS